MSTSPELEARTRRSAREPKPVTSLSWSESDSEDDDSQPRRKQPRLSTGTNKPAKTTEKSPTVQQRHDELMQKLETINPGAHAISLRDVSKEMENEVQAQTAQIKSHISRYQQDSIKAIQELKDRLEMTHADSESYVQQYTRNDTQNAEILNLTTELKNCQGELIRQMELVSTLEEKRGALEATIKELEEANMVLEAGLDLQNDDLGIIKDQHSENLSLKRQVKRLERELSPKTDEAEKERRQANEEIARLSQW